MMRKTGILSSIVLGVVLSASSAMAANYGMAGCGIGAMAFQDQPGKIQIVAATLNNLISPQTSAITSGTSNCVDEERGEQAALFININQAALQKDISRGNGETLTGLSTLLGCEDANLLGSSLQKSYQTIFPSVQTPAAEVTRSIDNSIRNDAALAKSCKLYS